MVSYWNHERILTTQLKLGFLMTDDMVQTVKKILLDLEAKGMIKIDSYDKTGQPIYALTKDGKEALQTYKVAKPQDNASWN